MMEKNQQAASEIWRSETNEWVFVGAALVTAAIAAGCAGVAVYGSRALFEQLYFSVSALIIAVPLTGVVLLLIDLYWFVKRIEVVEGGYLFTMSYGRKILVRLEDIRDLSDKSTKGVSVFGFSFHPDVCYPKALELNDGRKLYISGDVDIPGGYFVSESESKLSYRVVYREDKGFAGRGGQALWVWVCALPFALYISWLVPGAMVDALSEQGEQRIVGLYGGGGVLFVFVYAALIIGRLLFDSLKTVQSCFVEAGSIHLRTYFGFRYELDRSGVASVGVYQPTFFQRDKLFGRELLLSFKTKLVNGRFYYLTKRMDKLDELVGLLSAKR